MRDEIYLKAVDFNCLNCEKQFDDCEKTLDCCCKSCFKDGETNLLKTLGNKELDFLVDGKQQILYKPGETIINKIQVQPTLFVFVTAWLKFMWKG
jgi:copper chaperone CopZ